MQLTDLLSRLNGVERRGNQHQAKCPVHDDNKPSLSVSESDGKILLHCHAKCSTESIVAALGLEMKDLFTVDKPLPNRADNKPKRDITAVYDYKDLDGNIVHSTVRYDPKDFRQRRPDPNNPGKYIWKNVFEGVTPILYNLQAVTQAIKDNRPVFVVEGEKDCETLAGLGFTATTCPMGAGKWSSKYSDMLKDSTVYIMADNDEAGKSHALNVAKSLSGKAAEVYMIDITTETPETITEIPKGWDITDLLKATPQEKQKAVVVHLTASSTQYGGDGDDESDEDVEGGSPKGKKSQAELLMNLIKDSGVDYFHSDIKELYAALPVDGHVEVTAINSRNFELWLNRQFYNAYDKPISKDAIKQVLSVLSAKALYDNPTPVKLNTRVAEYDGAFWYDLTNKSWQAVKTTTEGWEVVDNPPLIFERHNHQSPQVMPIKGGDIRKILNYVNIKEYKTLFLCDLVSKFIPNFPHPMPDFHGEKGAAKSTVSVLMKLLIDPSKLRTLGLPKDERDFVVVFREHWFVPFDNIGFISTDISNMFCRVIVGDGIQQRRLHTNSESVIFELQRCIAVNGIDIVPTKSDLLDRTILYELMRIDDADRRELSEVMAAFEADRAYILGGIFDVMVNAKSIYPTVKLQGLKRMADFTRWGYAIGEALGGLGGEFLAEYQQNNERQNDEVMTNDPVATLTIEFMKDRNDWYGTHSALHDKFVELAESCAINTKNKNFPRDAAALGRRLRSIMSNLRQEGILYMPEKRKTYGVPLSLKKQNNLHHPTSSSRTAENQGFVNVGSDVGNHVGHEPASYPTCEPTLKETAENKALEGAECRMYDDVGIKPLLGEQSNGWFTVCEDVNDADIPPEFLKPTPPPQEKPMEQVQLAL